MKDFETTIPGIAVLILFYFLIPHIVEHFLVLVILLAVWHLGKT